MAASTLEKLKKVSKKFPNQPGVYFFLRRRIRLRRRRLEDGEPLYIGRAGSLKKRIANYFLTKRDPRISEMTQLAHALDFETTETLLEAIVLEANLIKQYWPKYNVMEKDGKSFMYMVITEEEFPRVLMIRGRELDKYKISDAMTNHSKKKTIGALEVFGPYQSYYLLRKALEIVRKIFPYSNCKPGQMKPCFHYQIGLCPGVCVGAVDQKIYRNDIRNIILFFRGEKKQLLKKLQKENPEAILALKQVRDTALLADSDVLLRGNQLTEQRIEGYDISHLSGREPVGAMVVFENGEPDPSQYRLFKIRGDVSAHASPRASQGKMTQSFDDLKMLEEVIERRLRHLEWPMPSIIFVDGGANQVKRVNAVLKKHNFILPVVGLSKSGQHAASSAGQDKFVVANAKKVGKELIIASRNLFQQIRNEAHRFSINARRKRGAKSFLKK